MSPSGGGETARLAAWAAGLRYEDLPAAVVRETKRQILDTLGVAIGAAGTEAPDIVLATVREAGGAPQAAVLGYGERTSAVQAALVDGVLSHVFDYDDTHSVTILHGSGPTLSAALAVGEWRERSGRDLVVAHAAGFEAGARVSVAVWPEHYDAGWHMTGTAGTICAAAASARLLELDPGRATHALGMAATFAGGHREHFGSMTKSLHAGRAAADGVLAAQLAARGFTASTEGLEGRRGLFAVMSTRADPEAVTRDLGRRWEVARNGFKPYACGLVTHPAIDAARELRGRGVGAEDVERLHLRVHPLVLELCGKRDVRTGLEGKFSVATCVALMLCDGAARQRQFTDESVRRPHVQALAARVSAEADESIGLGETRAQATLRDGGRQDVHVTAATGTPANPISDEELRAKFLDLVVGPLGERAAHRIVETVDGIESCERVADLVALASRHVPASAGDRGDGA